MRSSKKDEAVYRRIADDGGLSPSEVRKAVASFFDIVAIESRTLPFDNPRKIYSVKAFKEFERVYCIPYVGRIGTSHSRYLKWRANESKNENMVLRSSYKNGLNQDDIEYLAMEALSGKNVKKPNNRKVPYKRVWMIGEEGKRQARQVIPKEKEDV